jgi:deoxyadenosine/deoxycytidine kinase
MKQLFTRIFSIEGNIGSGKSTLLENLKKELSNNKNIIFMKEPVDEWEEIKDASGNTMLQKFYEDQEKYSFPFQMMAYISRLNLLKTTVEKNPGAIIISERSLYTDKFVFAKMLYESGKIEDVNYQIYNKWFDAFVKDFPISGVIYVETDPEICHERISRRSRLGESNIPMDYLSSCHGYHATMLNRDFQKVSNRQLVLDGNTDIYENRNVLDEWIENIKTFVGSSSASA